MLSALIFDVDGTLADTERHGHRVAFNLAFADAGLDWHWDESLYGRLLAVAGGKERMRHFIETCQSDPPIEGAQLSAFIENLQATKTRHYAQLVGSGSIPPRPGVLRLLKEAREKGLRLAIATTTTPQNVDALLAAAFSPDAISWFEVIAAGDIVPQKKPAPDIYQHTLQKLGLDAANCMAFEDSENGLRAALNAGIATVVTVNDYTSDQDFSGAAMVTDHLGDDNWPCRRLDADAPSLAMSGQIDVALLQRLHRNWFSGKQ